MSETSPAPSADAVPRSIDTFSNAHAAHLERRVEMLEDEVRRRYAEAHERDALIHTLRARNEIAYSREAREIRDLFRGIAERMGGKPSLVTVVIPVYGKIDYTLRCLRSIAVTWSDTVNPTIVVVDDASPDQSVHDLAGIPLIDLLRNGKNAGYLRSTNRGSLLATTPYVCFLNNDIEVMPGWLDYLVQTLEQDPHIGAAGSKLVYPDGTLQEAGSIIWSDASGWNYGRNDDPLKPEYNFRRDVDFCSAASMLIRTELLREIGGFDDRYAPAYYEDADLCFEVRARGYRTVYEPGSEVIHYEGVSSGTDLASGVKHYQVVNQPKFQKKWEMVLASHFPASPENVAGAIARTQPQKTVLVVDSYVPMHDREAGSNRLFKIVQILRTLEYHVIFLPDNFVSIEPYTSDLVRLGVVVLYGRERGPKRDDLLRYLLQRVDVAWVCRPELCSHYLPLIRSCGNVPVIYDTIDLHFTRERKRAEIEGLDESVWRGLQDLELSTARAADLVVTVTEAERETLRSYGIEHVDVIPTIHDSEPHEHFSFGARSGIIFIGGYGHHPNVDAVLWLCRDIMPIVWQTLPAVHVTLLGNQPPESVMALRSARVSVTGFVADVGPYFEEARVFVAPLRYGAGMKGKVGHALSYELPIVTTSVGADGYDLAETAADSIADDAETFAAKIVALYCDEALWERNSDAGARLIARLGIEAVAERLAALLDALKAKGATRA